MPPGTERLGVVPPAGWRLALIPIRAVPGNPPPPPNLPTPWHLAEIRFWGPPGGPGPGAPASNAPGDYRWQSPLEVPAKDLDPIPEWILESLEKRRHGGKQRLSDQDWLDLCGGVGEGRRNDAMARLVGKWISMDYDPAETLALAMSVNAQNKPPLRMEEVEQIVVEELERVS